MLDQRKLQRQDTPREEEFIRRYPQLLSWAMRLTNHHRASAEDLVQDAFIQFTRVHTNLESIENLGGYLYRMLRNMHISRLGRNAEQVTTHTLSIADLELELDSPGDELQQRLQTHEELCRVCQYACIRKETSRAGSVLILRFFLEYSPSEIAEVLCTSRHCIDQWLRFARRELKVYLESPKRLRFVTSSKWAARPPKAFATQNLADELRSLIFSSRQGPCFSVDELRRTYNADAAESLVTTRLAHLVSCTLCLDEVNRMLGLPTLEHRLPRQSNESPGPPTASSGFGGGSDEGPTDVTSRLQQHLDVVVNQRPKELRISVNGSPIGTLKIGSSTNEVDINLPAEEGVEFIEIVSEDGCQLLFFSLDDDHGFSEQWAQMELSEGRTLEARFCHTGSSCVLRVGYQQDVSLTPLVGFDSHTTTAISEWQNVSHTETITVTHNPFIDASTERKSIAETVRDIVSSAVTWFGRGSWLNPQFATVVAAMALITGILFVWLHTDADSILNRAMVAEEQSTEPGRVLHRILRFESKRIGDLTPTIETINIWEDKAKGQIARRVYDEKNVLIAGDWRNSDGARLVYHHQSGFKSVAIRDDLSQTLMWAPWRLDISAKTFRSILDAAELEVVKGPTDYTLTWEGTREIGSVKLLSASLTVTDRDFRVVRQSLEIEAGDGRYEYVFAELKSERLPEQQVLPENFTPDSFVNPQVSLTRGSANFHVPNDSSHRITYAPGTASTELEIEAAYLLNRAKSNGNEQIALTRTRTGLLLIEGVVETEKRKKEIEAVLNPISKHPLVRIALRNVADAVNSKMSRPTTIVTAAPNTENTIAVDRELRNYLSLQNVNDIDEAAQQLSATVVRSSYNALFHAVELKRLRTRFSNIQLRSVSPDARDKWLQMVHQHADGYLAEVVNLRRILGPLFFSKLTALRSTTDTAILNDDEMTEAIDQIWKIALSNNRAVRDGFTISSESSGLAVTSTTFWQSLITSEMLAVQIKRYENQ